MRHNAFGRKLGRTTPHRLAMFRNQLASLMSNERIVTTLQKAKELRPIAERVVTHGKRGTVHARRLVGRWIPSRELVKRVFDEIAPRFDTRPGGYLRIVKLGPRQGDGAEMAVLEFVDFQLKKKAAPAAAAEEKGKKGKAKDESAAEATEGGEKSKQAKATRTQRPPAAKAPGEKKAKAAAKGEAHLARPVKAPASKKQSSTPKKVGS
jgi:large subunit ribosomal protein L17